MSEEGREKRLYDKIDVNSFYSHADELSDKIYNVPCLVENKYPKQRPGDLFTFYQEATLANDIAYIASSGVEPEDVTAATVEARNDGSSIVVRIAANNTIKPSVEPSMNRILYLLRVVALHGATKDTLEDVLGVIVSLNRNKLFYRLDSRHFVQIRKPISPHLLSKNLKKSLLQPKYNTFRSHNPEFVRKLNEFDTICTSLESAIPEKQEYLLKQAIKCAFSIYRLESPTSRRRVLEVFGKMRGYDKAYVLQLSQIARYLQITHNLISIAQNYPQLFHSGSLRIIPHRGANRGKAVHAEILLILSYEASGPSVWPRAIGSSKAPCYLCKKFMHFHGFFATLYSHGKFYNKWTLPNDSFPSVESLDRMARSFNQLHVHIKQLCTSNRGSGLPPDRESVISLTEVAFRGPSTVDLRPSIVVDAQGSQDSIKSVESNNPVTAYDHPERRSVAFTTSRGISDRKAVETSSRGIDIEPPPFGRSEKSQARCYSKEWLNLYVHFDNMSLNRHSSKTFNSIKLEPLAPKQETMRELRNPQTITISDLEPGQEISFFLDEQNPFSFIVNDKGKCMVVNCQ